MTRWCRDHKVASIGHFLEHNHEYLDQNECAGNMMQLQKYSDMGAIDAVFKQFVPGRKDGSTYQTPKLGSSITHAYGKAEDLTMVEIFGARGQDLSYPEMKWWTDLMQVAGVNFLIPHSFNPRAPYDTDCPPYFYNGGYEPRWPLYKVFADYTSRLSLILSGGRHVAPVALLFLGHSRQVGRSVTPETMTTALQDALYDCDWLPYEVVENDAQVVGNELQLRQERYRVLVVPPVEVVPPAALAKARSFFEAGGVVIGHGFLPSKSATPGKTGGEVQSLCEAIWGKPAGPGLSACNRSAAGGRAYFLPESPTPEQLHAVLADDAGISPDLDLLEGRTNHWLHVLHRVKSGRDVFFITNQNVDGKAERFRFKVRAQGVPECWDAMRDEITAVPFRRDGEHVELTLALEPLESVLLVFWPAARPLPPRPGTRNDPPGARSISVVRDLSAPEAKQEPPPAKVPDFARSLDGCSWVWYPEGEPATAAPPGSRFFRKAVELPADRTVTRAIFAISADNEFVLHVNGAKLGQSGGGAGDWTRPAEVDVTTALRAGSNVLAIQATNTSRQPNPAGLIGRLRVEFDRGDPLAIAIDPTWKAGRAEQSGWTERRFDDGGWASAREVAPLGGGPWGRMSGGGPTLSPVRADPFVGRADLPSDVDLDRARVLLQLDELAPEAAARVTVNGHDAGGFIGRPFRLDVTRRLRPGANTIRIEPFAPRTARLVIAAP
ncbi:MAG: glycosyl hydrolase [Isosphaeraceae bacterium]